MLKSDPPIIVEQELQAPVTKIWSALTELKEMKKWYFDILEDFKAEVGFKTNFDITHQGRLFPHYWEVTEVVPEQKIVVRWYFKGYEGSSNVIFEILPGENNNLVRLTAVATEDHPQDIPEFRRESGVGGWNFFVKERLKDYFEEK